jgi:hypothetical protein
MVKVGRTYSQKDGATMNNVIVSLLKHGGVRSLVPNFALLMHVVLICPVGSVPNERAHWYMDLLRGDLRHSLKEEHLNTCALLYTCGISYSEFPYHKALVKFEAMRKRRGGG